GDARLCLDSLVSSDLTGDAGVGSSIDPGVPGGQYVPLSPGSAAVDAGDDTVCPDRDQTHLRRFVDGNGDGSRACDIGAIEFYPVVNDRVRIRIVDSRKSANHHTQLTAVATNTSGQDICDLAF